MLEGYTPTSCLKNRAAWPRFIARFVPDIFSEVVSKILHMKNYRFNRLTVTNFNQVNDSADLTRSVTPERMPQNVYGCLIVNSK